MAQKKLSKNKKVQKEVELPSFLSELTEIPENFRLPPRPTKSEYYLGPIFWGHCTQFHPPLHKINFNPFRGSQKSFYGKEDISGLFFPKTIDRGKPKELKTVRIKSGFKRIEVYSDPFPHRCLGVKKVFVHEVKPPVIDLGESTSIIEGETTLEIPLCRVKTVVSGTNEPEFEFVRLSDIQERKRKFLSYRERMSHIHYPKQFATVTVIGPTIPAPITITKLPSKRERKELFLKADVKKTSKEMIKVKGDKTEDLAKEVRENKDTTDKKEGAEVKQETQFKDSSEVQIEEIESYNAIEGISEVDMGGESLALISEQNLETIAKTEEEDAVTYGESSEEGVKESGMEVTEINGENEEQEEENVNEESED